MDDGGDDWQLLLAQHGAALVLFARHLAASRADAEDIVQEAFLRYWRTRQRVEEPRAYLFACVRRCALDWRRASRRRTGREAHAARTEAEQLFICPAENNERRELIEAAIQRLPDEQAEVVLLKIWGGLSFPQIGQALGIPENTAASRYRYALAKLRQVLAEEPSYE